jgi:hypothetical protein
MNASRLEKIKAAVEKINAEKEESEQDLNFEDVSKLHKAAEKWIDED